jgi:hypothetical protein
VTVDQAVAGGPCGRGDAPPRSVDEVETRLRGMIDGLINISHRLGTLGDQRLLHATRLLGEALDGLRDVHDYLASLEWDCGSAAPVGPSHPCAQLECCQGWNIFDDGLSAKIEHCDQCRRFESDEAALVHILACKRCFQEAASLREEAAQ